MRRKLKSLKENVRFRLTINIFWRTIIGLALVQIYTPILAYCGLRYLPIALGVSYLAYMLYALIKSLHIISF